MEKHRLQSVQMSLLVVIVIASITSFRGSTACVFVSLGMYAGGWVTCAFDFVVLSTTYLVYGTDVFIF